MLTAKNNSFPQHCLLFSCTEGNKFCIGICKVAKVCTERRNLKSFKRKKCKPVAARLPQIRAPGHARKAGCKKVALPQNALIFIPGRIDFGPMVAW